jgi:hypothetical protein
MKIYKFKDLTDENKHSHFLEIVLKNSIWCARPDSLNDKEEFITKLDYEPSLDTRELLTEAVAKFRTTDYSHQPYESAFLTLEHKGLDDNANKVIENMVNKCRAEIGITSFALEMNNQLWNEYGGNGNGVCVEINIPDHFVGKDYHPVQYLSDKTFHVDSFLKSVLFHDKIIETYRNVLLTKTKEWEQEKEIRFIGNRQDVTMILSDCYISEITFGSNVPKYTLETLVTSIANHCKNRRILIKKLSN